MKKAGKFLIVLGLLMWALLLVTGPMLIEARSDLDDARGLVLSPEFQEMGAHSQDQFTRVEHGHASNLAALLGLNRFLMGGGALAIVAGIAARVAGKKPKRE